MKIGVVGLGLIGGSIFKELSTIKDYEVIGVSRSVKTKNVSNNYQSLKNCDLVFVCTPIDKTLETLDKLDKILDSKTIVTDVCSVKGFVSKKKYNFKFIPSHPMAGTEYCGWENSFIGLFKGAKWAITPIEGEILSEQDILERIIQRLGATPITTSAEEHDKAVALISHLPLFVAQALCKNIESNKLAQELCATGFKDTTRLALSNLEMAKDMLNYNGENINLAYDDFAKNFNVLIEGNYIELARKIKEFRKNLYS